VDTIVHFTAPLKDADAICNRVLSSGMNLLRACSLWKIIVHSGLPRKLNLAIYRPRPQVISYISWKRKSSVLNMFLEIAAKVSQKLLEMLPERKEEMEWDESSLDNHLRIAFRITSLQGIFFATSASPGCVCGRE
jgi:hypothetical protein